MAKEIVNATSSKENRRLVSSVDRRLRRALGRLKFLWTSIGADSAIRSEQQLLESGKKAPGMYYGKDSV